MTNTTVNIDRILLTGLPGIGKTTIICKLCDIFNQKNIPIVGFFTDEIRNESNSRIGFDVVTLEGQVGRLARSRNILGAHETTKHFVGNYAVFIDEFESLVLPVLKYKQNAIFIVDEIGKMELFSDPFKKAVAELFAQQKIKILATIPVPKAKPLQFVEKLRNDPKNYVITVDKSNRNDLIDEILLMLKIN